MNAHEQLQQIINGDFKTLARTISQIENNNGDDLLRLLPSSNKKIIGVTGPPGAGKSTLVDGLIAAYVNEQKKVGVLCIDPSSAFSHGAILGDRIRMNRWHNNDNVFIRSLASRGNSGGLHPSIIEITDVMKAAPFDEIIIETVGAGQTETEIAALADTTVVVLVPEAGDDIQMMKAGLMEIADVFVVNKSDREGALEFAKNLLSMSPGPFTNNKVVPVVQTIAIKNEGIKDVVYNIGWHQNVTDNSKKKVNLLAEKAYLLIRQKRMKDVSKIFLAAEIDAAHVKDDFNLYRFIENYGRKLPLN